MTAFSKITIVGGGNMGMCLAGTISRNMRCSVMVLASHPEDFEGSITIRDEEKEIEYQSGLIRATDDIRKAISNADLILCTYPAFLREGFVRKASAYIKNTTLLGFVPAYGGAEFYCQDLIRRGVTIFGLQKPPYICRTEERGKVSRLMSTKGKLYLASIPNNNAKDYAHVMSELLEIPVEVLPNYMNVTLLPGNPLLHTCGSYYYLKDYQKGYFFPEQIYYYRSWNDDCSEIICRCSDEMEEVCSALPIDLSGVQSIQTYYESPTPQELTKKFHSIQSFQPLTLPMTKVEGGYIPNFQARYFTEDIPFGLCTIKALALITHIKTDQIDSILKWYYQQTGIQYFDGDRFGKDIGNTAIPQLFGLKEKKDITDFYLR